MPRAIVTAEILSIGSELTTGTTRDTNAGDLARDLTDAGVTVRRVTALPDDLEAVSRAFLAALEGADMVVSTGGLGPTPDDLTREAIAEALGEEPAIDPRLERWLRALWARRRMPFPEVNLKQAWLVPSATPVPNGNGTAPGWWVDRPDGRVIVALPGPPREMRPMWASWVLPRLHERSLGVDRVVRTLRTAGIGESVLAERLGDLLLTPQPSVATYARIDGVDIRITAVDEPERSADAIADEAVARIRELVGQHVWGREGDTWPGMVGAALAAGGWRLAIVEHGTGGATAALLGSIDGLARAVVRGPAESEPADAADGAATEADVPATADVVVIARATERREDTELEVTVIGPDSRRHVERRAVFLRGDDARGRLGAAVAQVLLGVLREAEHD